ncbi:MAG: HD domain-containing protein [Flavobacteriaceae bacterium]|nr:HD domain-containing protein [Flavobacteriaceae bacterium]
MNAVISNCISYVKKALAEAEAGHDWHHIQRVHRLALRIAAQEKQVADLLVVELAALLHDIADSKFHDGDEELGPKRAVEFMSSQNVSKTQIAEVELIIRNMSFRNAFDGEKDPICDRLEFKIVQDADRLDAIGAIGVSRALHYGGYKNRLIYDPTIEPLRFDSKEAYKKSKGPSLNHFYEKLLKIKGQLHTQTAIGIAEKRHAFMEQFLNQFYEEWGEKPSWHRPKD